MYQIRPIQAKDNFKIAEIIRQVSAEYGLAPSSGFAVADPILDQLFEFYQHQNAQYWVIENEDGKIFGGGGIAPLQGDLQTLEIQKMYFRTELRGLGFAKQLLKKCFVFAHEKGFKQIYLETTKDLWQAVKLYEKMGFQYLEFPMGQTGHSSACEIRMLKEL